MLDDWTDRSELGAGSQVRRTRRRACAIRTRRGARLRICIIGKYPPIQGGVAMRTYWRAHGLAALGHEVHVVTNAKEAVAPYRVLMRADDWARCSRRVRHRFGDGALDRPGRCVAVLHSDGEPLRFQARRHRGPRAFRTALRRHSFPLSRALWGRRAARGADHRGPARRPNGRKRCGAAVAPSAARGALRSRVEVGRGGDLRRRGRGATRSRGASIPRASRSTRGIVVAG